MKTFFALALAASLIATPALAQQYLSHDSQSGRSGSVVRRGNTGVGYDSNGGRATWVRHGNTITVNDRGIRTKINVVTQGNTSTFYRNGKIVGRAVYGSNGSGTFYHPNGAPGVTLRRVGP